MRQKKIVASRFLTSTKFAPIQTKSIEQRVQEFAQGQIFTSIYPFSPNYAVKAAMGGRSGGKNRNAAADNKERRKKESKLTRLGTYCFDPNAKAKPNQYFEIKPRFNLDGLLGDVPNIGWLDLPKTTDAENYNQQVTQFLQSQTEPQVIARPAKMNKRTGQLSVKALGPNIGGTVGNLGQAAARAIGIIIDASGRMRCPPGVPAANQFTDDIGSNCFDFTPLIGRAVMKIIQNVNHEIFQDVLSINEAIPTMRGNSGEVITASPEVMGRVRRGLASSAIMGPTGELLGPDGRPIVRPPAPLSPDLIRDIEEIRASAKTITPDRYEEEFSSAIRAAFPEKSEEEIRKLIKQAVQRQQFRDKADLDVQEIMDFAAELGVMIDPNDPDSVQNGLAKVFLLLKTPEHGGWGITLGKYFGKGIGRNFDTAMSAHREKQLQLILRVLMTQPNHFGLSPDELDKLVNSKYGGNHAEFQKALMEVLTGAKSVSEAFGDSSEEGKIIFKAQKKFDELRKMEAGYLIGILNQRRRNPRLMDNLRRIEFLSPFDKNQGGSDAVAYAAELDGSGFYIALNPLRPLLQNDFDPESKDFTLFEPTKTAGTEVAKLQAISSSLDRAGAAKAKTAYFEELMSLDALEQSVEQGNAFIQRYIQKSMGEIGQAIYIINHEVTHGRQLLLIERFLKSIPGLKETMTNKEILLLAEKLLSGKEKYFSVFGQDWDYASIISNSDWLPGAIDNLPEIMQVLLSKKAGGRYAMQHYYRAAFLSSFADKNISRVEDLYLPLMQLHQQMKTMDRGSTKYQVALRVYEEMAEIYQASNLDKFNEIKLNFQISSATTIAEMQAELAAGIESGFIQKTPEIEAFLGPLNYDSDISPDFGVANPSAKPVISINKDTIKAEVKKRLRLTDFRQKRKNRAMIDAGIDRLSPVDDFGLDEEIPESLTDVVSRVKEALRGFASRSQASRTNNLVRESVLENATSQQKQILEANWRNSLWNTSDPTTWARALQGRPEEVVNAIEQQFIPFMDLIDSSELPTDFVAEINFPSNSFDTLDGERGTKIAVNKHFTAVIHSAEDIGGTGPSRPSEQQGQRMMILVPEGSTGLPDNTPGTQKGEIGALILPPGEIEIIGKTKNNVIVGQVTSQRNTETQLNELRQTFHSLGSNESRPLAQRIIAKRAENRIERRQEAARINRTQTAVAMEVDPRKSKLAQKIEYDPQTQTLKVSYRNGTTREFENVSYGKVRDAGAANRPDDLILELEKIPRTYNPDKELPRSRGLASSTVDEINKAIHGEFTRQKNVDILARAEDIGVDLDRQEREILPRVIGERETARLSPRSHEYLQNIEIAPKLNDYQKQTVRGYAKDLGKSDQDILRELRDFDNKDSFGLRLEVMRLVAEERGDKELVSQIDNFIQEIQSMTPEQYNSAVKDAAANFESPFDSRPIVMMGDTRGLIENGRYETVHSGRKTQGGDPFANRGLDVPAIRRTVENQLMRFPVDTDSKTTSLRPSSGQALQKGPSSERIQRLRSIYGDDVEIQHDAPSVGRKGRDAAQTGVGNKSSKVGDQYGRNSIVLRPEVAQRTLAVSGDTASDQTYTGGGDVLEAGARLSRLSEDGSLAAMFFQPLAVLFENKTGRKDTIASALYNQRKRYVESLTLGSFDLSDVESIVSESFDLRGDHIWAPAEISMLGINPRTSFTNLIAAARQRDDVSAKHGIDVIIDDPRFFDLDEVEPFNTSMTQKYVENKISSGKWSDVTPEDLIANEKTTPYEALLRYQKIRVEKGENPIPFDHPDNDSSDKAKNKINFISMVDEELKRINPTFRQSERGLASSTHIEPRGIVSEEPDGGLRWVPLPDALMIVDEDWEDYLRELKIHPQAPRQLIKVDTVEDAVMALLDGHDVDMPDIEGAHTLIDDFARMVVALEKMVAEGQIDKETLDNFVFDLCQVTVRGVSAFCLGNKGIPRYLMPQAEGKVRAGSLAEKLLEKQNAERLAKGGKAKDEVDANAEFVKFLKERGLEISDPQYVQSDKLKATQRDMQGRGVAGMMASAKAGTFKPGEKPIFISRDGYVIDGHHRWAAQLGLDFKDGILGNNHEMNVRVVDAPISQIIRLANEFTEYFGIAKKPVAKRTDTSQSYSKDVLQAIRNSALLGGMGEIDFGNLNERERNNVVDFARDLVTSGPQNLATSSRGGLASSTTTVDVTSIPSEITPKNRRIKGDYEYLGIKFGKPSGEALAEKQKKRKDWVEKRNNPFGVVTPDDARYESHEEAKVRFNEVINKTIDKAKTGEIVEEWNYGRPVSPEVLELLRNNSPEEIKKIAANSVRKYIDGLDKRPIFRIRGISDEGIGDSPDESPLYRFIKDKKWKTTHDPRQLGQFGGQSTASSESADRKDIELLLGIPSKARNTIRPAHGFLKHPDEQKFNERHLKNRAKQQSEKIKEIEESVPNLLEIIAIGDEDSVGDKRIDDPNSFEGKLVDSLPRQYGHSEIILKPETAQRSLVTFGDSFSGMRTPVSLDGSATDDELLEAAILNRYLARFRTTHAHIPDSEQQRFINLLEASVSNDFAHLTSIDKDYRFYIEAIVAGGFDMNDVEEIRIEPEFQRRHMKNDGDAIHPGQRDTRKVDEKIIEDFFGKYLSKSELSLLQKIIENKDNQYSEKLIKELRDEISARARLIGRLSERQRIRELIAESPEERPKVTFLNHEGLDWESRGMYPNSMKISGLSEEHELVDVIGWAGAETIRKLLSDNNMSVASNKEIDDLKPKKSLQKSASGTRGLASSTSTDSWFGENFKPGDRSSAEKLDQGPLELPHGRDELGIPRVEAPENLKKKFGYSPKQVRKYFKKTYGIDVEMSKSLFKEKDKNGRPLATNFAGYAAVQALDDLLSNVPGMKLLLKDNNFSVNITDGGIEGRSEIFVPTSVFGTFGPRVKFFRAQRFKEGNKHKTRIDINAAEIKDAARQIVSLNWGQHYQPRRGTFGARGEVQILAPGGSTPVAFGKLGLPKYDVSYDDPNKLEELTGQIAGRIAYGSMIHEFGHLLDFSVRDKSASKIRMPSLMGHLLKRLISKGQTINLGGDPDEIFHSALRAEEIEKRIAATRYAASKATEGLAEAFASWFLFSRAPDIRTEGARMSRTHDVSGKPIEQVMPHNWQLPAEISRETLLPLIEKLGLNIKSANVKNSINLEDLDPIVLAFAIMPLLAKNKKSDKIGRRRARRISQNQDERKEFVRA